MKKISPSPFAAGLILVLATLNLLSACSSLETPATADVAVSKAALDSASAVGANEYAPVEMNLARDKLRQANMALANKDYALATTLANQAQADSKLAQSKANSEKAQVMARALQEDIRVLQEELNRRTPAPVR